ncbi:MAG: RQC domain-containing protein, partial [Pacificimonas sp.]
DVARARSQLAEGVTEEKRRVDEGKLAALSAFAASTVCRRIALLTYFGEPAPEPCGNCDNCLNPPELTDVTDDAIKLLSGVYRTGQRYGLGHVADVLAGVANDRAVQLGHDRLGVFALTPDKAARDWKPIQQQLVAEDALRVDPAYGGIMFGPNARAVLKGEKTVEIGPQPEPSSRRRRGRARAGSIPLNAADDALFEMLRETRKTLAEEQGVPAYVIFHDATLREMAATRPADLNAMAEVSGVGAAKLEKYGAAFLAAVSSS